MTYAKKTLSEIKLIHGDYGNFIKGQKLPKDKEKKYKTPPYKDLAASNEIDGETLNEKCWPGYEKKGMKTMFGKRYPNCVKKKKTRKEDYSDWRSEINIDERKMTEKEKRKDDRLKKKYEKSDDMMKSFKDQYGEKEGEKIFYAKIRKEAMKEGVGSAVRGAAKFLLKKAKKYPAAGAVGLGAATGTNLMLMKKELQQNLPKKDKSKELFYKEGVGSVVKGGLKLLTKSKPLLKTASGNLTKAKPKPSLLGKAATKVGGALTPGYIGYEIGKDMGKTERDNIKKELELTKQGAAYDQGYYQSAVDSYKKQLKDMKKKSVKEDNIQEILDKKDVPHIKKLIKKLKDGSELHAKQSKDLEVALNTENTAIESELVIQDWNSDDIKFTEIETVDIIKAKPLLDEKFQFLKKAFGKAVILGKGADKMMGKSPRLSRKASIGLTTGKALKGFKDAIQKVKDMKKIDAPPKFPRDASRTITKTTDNIITIDPSKMEKKPRIIKKKNPPSLKDHFDWRNELDEDWQKVNRKDKTDGLSRKAVKAYRRENPGSKLQTAVTKDPKKLKKGSKSAKRRLSFCRRMKGMKKKLTSAKTARDPNSRINKALRRWNC